MDQTNTNTVSDPTSRPSSDVLLSCRGVGVRFGGLRALDDVDLEVREGEIVGLIGPNGAGKTTLMECISGFQPVQTGRITYRGHDLLDTGPGQRAALGIGRTLQNVRLFPYLSAADNLRVALHRHHHRGALEHAFSLPAARHEEAAISADVAEIVDLLGLAPYAEKFASELSYGTLRLLELACMVALRPDFLLLDEPASGISQKETEALGPLLGDIRDRTGATILMIEHDMPLVMGLADWMYCLDAGRVLAEGLPADVQTDPSVAEAYLGTSRDAPAKEPARPAAVPGGDGEPMLRLSGVDVFYEKVQVLYGIDFEVHEGERVALLGTNGAGKSTILKAASGLIPVAAGSVHWKGEDITGTPAERVMRRGLGQVPGGRSLFPTLSVEENLRMGGYVLDPAEVAGEMERVISYFPWIRNRLDQPAGTLSGGEQQQLATARTLMNRPQLLMIDELSLGLAPVVIENLIATISRLCDEEGLTLVVVEQQASFALDHTDRAYFLEKGEVRYEGPSAGLAERGDLLRSVFLAGASAGFAGATR